MQPTYGVATASYELQVSNVNWMTRLIPRDAGMWTGPVAFWQITFTALMNALN